MVNSTKTVKKANKKEILNTIRQYGPLTLEEIIFKKRISRPTVVNIVKELQERNIVSKVGFAKAEHGRNPMLMDINKSLYFSIGVDMEFPEIRICIMNLKSEITAQQSLTLGEQATNPNAVLENVANLIITTCKQNSLNLEYCIGIGVGISGRIESSKGISVYSERAHNWKNINIKDYLFEKLNVPISIKNDVHLLALAEKKVNPITNQSDFIYLAIRSGVGAAVFINGKPYYGHAGNAGFVGHMTIDINGDLCKCGNRGCLELHVSKPNIIKNYKNLLKQNNQTYESDISLQNILDKFENSDETASVSIKKMIEYLSAGIINLVNLFDINTVILGGLPLNNSNLLLERLNENINSKGFSYSTDKISVTLGKVKTDECSSGCAHLILDKFFSNF